MKPDEPEIPDLVLEAPKPAAHSARASSAPSRSATPNPTSGAVPRGTWGASSAFGAELELSSLSEDPIGGAGARSPSHPDENEFDLFADALGGTDLGLDLERAYSPEPAAPATASVQSASVKPPAAAAQKRVSTKPPPRVWPTGRAAVAEELDIDPLEVAIAAGFDDPPSSVVVTPFYALRVFMRRRALLPAERSARSQLSELEKARDQLLVELAESARPLLESNDRMRSMLATLGESESLASERTNALSRASADVAGTESELDAKLASLEVERKLTEKDAASAQSLAERAEEALKRVELQVKRIEIERRSVLDVARHKLGPAGGALPPELASKLAELDERKAALNPELEGARRERDAAKQSVDQMHGKLRALGREARVLAEAKQDYKARQQGELDMRARGVSEAEEQRRTALVTVGQRVLELRGEVPVDGARLDALTNADEAVARALLHAEKLRRALDSYDFEAAKKGRIIFFACCAVSLLSVLVTLFS